VGIWVIEGGGNLAHPVEIERRELVEGKIA
jgi:hypothetical protein